MEHFLWVYGLVQGVTEAIPVSSSSHIRLVALWMSHLPSLALESALHIGTGLAFCGAYPSSIVKIFIGFGHILKRKYSTPEARWWIFSTLASLPVLILGGILHVLHLRLQRVDIIAFLCAGFGLLLWWCDEYGPRFYSIKLENFQKGWVQRACILGTLQMCALFPGVSRLGACLLACRCLGYSRGESLRISIALGIISIFACVTLEAPQWISLNFTSYLWIQIIGITFVTCWGTLWIFRYYINRISFLWFFIYRCGLAIILLYSCILS
ncbi:undecaprenyl-diphosphate phosphatase [Holospora curviuscula]|uniref:Undecaprenyl-diphosphatase n=1 Tax=Holospora curviuscula TaxID=1082868 RepID=A0A2S5RHW8_9PROT|nr:undecaprenyl-diphosphate phosphatase [Holospora curviuscula]PPE06916.1 Undecaprenyl-diphosphatase [Holospora curviuscula]